MFNLTLIIKLLICFVSLIKFYSREPEEVEESERETNCLLPEVEDILEESDPNIFDIDGTDDNVVSVGASSPKDQEVTRSPQENKKTNSKKTLKKMTSKKAVSLSSSTSGVDNSNSQEISSMATEVDAEKQLGLESKSEAVSAIKASTLDHGICGSENNSKKEQQKRNLKRSMSKDRTREKGKLDVSTSKSKGQKRGSLEILDNDKLEENKQEKEASAVAEMAEAELQEEPKLELKGEPKGTEEKTKTKKKPNSSQDEMQPEDANQQGEVTEKKKKGKKKRSVDVEEESNEVFQEDTPSSKSGVKSKEKKKDSPGYGKSKEKLNKKLSRNKKSKAASDDNLVAISEMTDEQFQPDNTGTPENPLSKSKSSVGGMASTNDKSARKESAIIEDKDEPLGDMSFLINVNSRISIFVADASQDECELDPMTARERNDVYKVAQLYKLRARIGTKAETNLTTVRLSKQADTQMPKPGRVDRLLSELSIAASKDSPKSQVKRKHAATVDENEQSASASNNLHCDGPPKKKLSKLSRTKKM